MKLFIFVIFITSIACNVNAGVDQGNASPPLYNVSQDYKFVPNKDWRFKPEQNGALLIVDVPLQYAHLGRFYIYRTSSDVSLPEIPICKKELIDPPDLYVVWKGSNCNNDYMKKELGKIKKSIMTIKFPFNKE